MDKVIPITTALSITMQALADITYPLAALQRDARDQGRGLNGLAHSLADDPNVLRGVASEAMKQIASLGIDTDNFQVKGGLFREHWIADCVAELTHLGADDAGANALAEQAWHSAGQYDWPWEAANGIVDRLGRP